jgi:hypothetical protein
MAERPADQTAADRAQHRALTAGPRFRPVTRMAIVMMVIVVRRRRLGLHAAGETTRQHAQRRRAR